MRRLYWLYLAVIGLVIGFLDLFLTVSYSGTRVELDVAVIVTGMLFLVYGLRLPNGSTKHEALRYEGEVDKKP